MDFVITSSELCHYGIKMRSGRYPFGSGKNPGQHIQGIFDPTVKNGKDRPPISPAEKIAKETRNTAENVEKLARASRKKRNQEQNNVKEMSDEELKARIRRLELEQRYRDLSEKDIDNGRSKVEEYANIVMSTASVVGSVAAVISVLKGLKAGK